MVCKHSLAASVVAGPLNARVAERLRTDSPPACSPTHALTMAAGGDTPAFMLRLLASTRISVDEPTADGGFVTWFDIRIHRIPEGDDDDGSGGAGMEEGDEEGEQIGRAEFAIVHVGAVLESDDSVYDVLDADSGDLEALYHLYFDDNQDWFKDEFACAPGVDLGYLRDLTMEPAWQGRNIEFAVIQRLCDTIAAGCKVLVMPVSSPEEVKRWEPMGFEVPASEGTDPGHIHLNNELAHPRVVPVEYPRSIPEPHEHDRFKVLEPEDEDDEDPEDMAPSGSAAAPAPPTREASTGRSHGAVVRRAPTRRRPSPRRR